MTNEGIRVLDIPSCYLCGEAGTVLHDGLRDRLYGRPGVWQFLTCPGCGLTWLNPRPVPEDVHMVYSRWGTDGKRDRLYGFRKQVMEAALAALGHRSAGTLALTARMAARVICLLPPLREIVTMKVSGLVGPPLGRLIDVGPGSGEFLAQMRDLGWDVLGVEPDLAAARAATDAHGVEIVVGQFEETKLSDDSVDVVTLNHVIEHLPDPIAVLSECRRVLKPGGKLVLLTPNTQSWGHKRFGECWLPLEQPRHFILFSPRTLETTLKRAGFSIDLLCTTARNARGTWRRSRLIQLEGKASGSRGGLATTGASWTFQACEQSLRILQPLSGEELYATATPVESEHGQEQQFVEPSRR